MHARPGVAALLDLGEHHRVRDLHARAQRLGHRRDQALEGLLVPADKALGRLLGLRLAGLLGVAAGLAQRAGVLDVVLGGLGDDVALGVEAGASRAAHDLVELARVEVAHAPPVELGERGEHHGVDGNVDAHAQRVRAADDGQQPLLGELLHQKAVTRQHSGVVHAHAAAQEALQGLAEGGGEAGPLDGVLDGLALLLGGYAVARQALRARERRVLREVHHVQRRLARAQRELDGALERRVHELVGERHRARGVGDRVHRAAARVLGERGGDGARVAERGAHEQELRVGEGEQRHLPRPPAVGVGVEVELVHRHAAHVAALALAQGLVGEDLRRAADDRGLGVDGGVSGDHAHVLAAEELHEVKELLADQGLDRGGVVGAPVRAHAHEAHAQGHHGLARARGRAQDEVVARRQRQQGLLLVGPELDPA